MQNIAIAFENVSFSYDGNHPVLSGLSFEVEKGDFVALVGGNGSGKSTVALLADGLLLPQSGKVMIGGKSTLDANPFEIRRNVGMVFQNPDDQIVASIVENEVAFGPENLGIDPAEIRRRIADSLNAVGLSGFERHETNSLSGGQKQRLALAGALAMEPEILILDEASSMLDPEGRDEFMQVVCRLHKDGKTILMITHRTDEMSLANRVIELADGHTVRYEELTSKAKEGRRSKGTPRTLLRFAQDAAKASARSLASEADSANLLEFREVSYRYDESESLALEDICMNVREGEFLSIIGNTGSGKSTLIRHMNGLMHPTAGIVLLDGKNLSVQANANNARFKAGIVFQYPEQQLFAATVYDDVAFGPRNMKLKFEEVDVRIREALQSVSLDFDTFKARNPFSLSGGEQRRVAIAGVLAMKPDVLVLDEPCAGLDSQTHEEMIRMLEALHSEGRTIVMVSHDMDDVATLSTRVLHMRDGKIIA